MIVIFRQLTADLVSASQIVSIETVGLIVCIVAIALIFTIVRR